MDFELVIVGGGIGGLAAALGWARARQVPGLAGAARPGQALVLEQAAQFSELGAGLQLGPNAVRLLTAWGLGPQLHELAAHPSGLRVVDASDGQVLAHMPFDRHFCERHGGAYLTMHRADLHGLLRQALDPQRVITRTDATVSALHQTAHEVQTVVRGEADPVVAPALVACDGVWSSLREQLLGDGPAPATGHLALRAMLEVANLPAGVPHDRVSVWWGPRMHAVAYPVRAGHLMNLVVIAHEADVAAPDLGMERRWDLDVLGAHTLDRVLQGLDRTLRELVAAAPRWMVWRLHDRVPMDSPAHMAQGRVALLGDAAHPMRPYMAQGAAMAIEDAWVLARQLTASPGEPGAAIARYAQLRWRRAARVQHKSRVNGRIFHAHGLLRTGRNLALRLLGERLLDTPWLYGYRPDG